jgi:TRAP-type C4-dicarboxylate transport system permease small subunit
MSSSGSASVRSLLGLFTRINKIMVFVASTTLIATAVMLTYDVCRRYALNAPLPASIEISSLLQAWVIFLPFAFTLATGQHVRVTVLTTRLPKPVQKGLQVFAHLVTGAICLFLSWFAWVEFKVSWDLNEIMMAPVVVYWWAGKFAAPLGMLLFALQAFVLVAAELTAAPEEGR